MCSFTLPGEGFWHYSKRHLNFYRIHLIFFTVTPLITSAIFYASNSTFHISYIDALFNCVSAMTVCGLASVDLSTLTVWQQVILFVQMCFGSPVVVSWIMVYIRRRYFSNKFRHIVRAAARKASAHTPNVSPSPQPHRTWPLSLFRRLHPPSNMDTPSQPPCPPMIHQIPDSSKQLDPTESNFKQHQQNNPTNMDTGLTTSQEIAKGARRRPDPPTLVLPRRRIRRLSDPGTRPRSRSRSSLRAQPPLHRSETIQITDPNLMNANINTNPTNPRTRVTFAPRNTHNFDPIYSGMVSEFNQLRSHLAFRQSQTNLNPTSPLTLKSHTTTYTHTTTHTILSTKDTGFGGFPSPLVLISRLISHTFPRLSLKPPSPSSSSHITTSRNPNTTQWDINNDPTSPPPPSYISFPAITGHNSTFHHLTEDQLEELGGVEYRALGALLWIVAGYHIGTQLLSFTIMAPYMSIFHWSSDFIPPRLHKAVSPVWYSLFQVVSAYTNTGMSLVDQSMLPFQKAYPTIACMVFLILAGNTAFPIFLRLTIWLLTKIFPSNSRANETLHFLLDHPRRCYIHLFPSHQTWFLLTVVLGLTLTDWLSFLILDIGNSAIEAIPVGIRVYTGLLQAVSVRAAGFGIVPVLALAPAVKVLFVIMMYISVYPIAMSVRSTNVYEEQSLGIFNLEDAEPFDEGEHRFQTTGSRATVWGRYLAMHARRQLAFDIWWLGLALVLVCIVERSQLDNEDNLAWFNIFSIIFDLVSAYGTVGLSLGIPTQNYSFSGALRPLSKLIICIVMIRGRHRGLPVAIDRAVMLPAEFERHHSQVHPHQDLPYTEDDEKAEFLRPHSGGIASPRPPSVYSMGVRQGVSFSPGAANERQRSRAFNTGRRLNLERPLSSPMESGYISS